MDCLLVLLWTAQNLPLETLADKCDSQIEWLSDGMEVGDKTMGQTFGTPCTEPSEIFAKAKEAAKERNRLILWYVPRIFGRQMYRASLPDSYARIAFFTDPDVVGLLKRKFVPMRVAADRAMGAETGIRSWDFVEPAIVILTPEGEIVHTIDRIRTFNADWLIEVLVSVLRKHAKYDAVPDAASLEDLILGGNYDAARAKNPESYEAAVLARRCRKGEDALRLLQKVRGPEAMVERGRVLLAQGKIGEAKKAFEQSTESRDRNPRDAEALYFVGVCESWEGNDKKATDLWRTLTERHPDSPWAWRAAANLTIDQDTRPKGPAAHAFEDFAWVPDGALAELPKRTRWARRRADVKDVTERAVRFLLRTQRSNGGWEDSRYVYWPDEAILPNVWVAVSALAATALLEWRSVDPERIDAALAKAEKYFLDEARMARGKNEEPYADAFKILYLVRKHARVPKKEYLDAIGRIAGQLAASQKRDGWWAHEYPNPFCTAAVMHALLEAKRAGAKIDESLISKGADALLKTRGNEGAQAYDSRGRPSSLKDSAARLVLCENALYGAGRLKVADVAGAFREFWENRDRVEAVRSCDFHTDGELAGFFFFHGLFFASEAMRSLPEKERAEHADKFVDWVVSIPEFDGSFLDSHELGKSYGTAMALLVLRNSTLPK